MKISEHWSSYVTYTADLSEAARKAGFAGVAVCWLVRSGEFAFPVRVQYALAAIVGFLFADLLQLYVAAIIHRLWLGWEERRRQRGNKPLVDDDLAKPAWIDWPAFFLFNVKIILLAIGYSLLGLEVWEQVCTLALPNTRLHPTAATLVSGRG